MENKKANDDSVATTTNASSPSRASVSNIYEEKLALTGRRRKGNAKGRMERAESPGLESLTFEGADYEVPPATASIPGVIAVRGLGRATRANSETTTESWIANFSPAITHAPHNAHEIEEGQTETTLNATLVEESPSVVLASATLLDTVADEKDQRPHRMINIMVSCGIAIVISIVAVVVAVKLTQKKPESNQTLTPTSSPTTKLHKTLEENSFDDGFALSTDGSPQQLAAEWLESKSGASKLTDGGLLQIYALATLYHATSGDQWKNYGPNQISDSLSWLSSIFYCDWGGLICSEDKSRIISLELYNNTLKGSIPAEIGHLSSLGTSDGGL